MLSAFIELKDFLKRWGVSIEEFFEEVRRTRNHTKQTLLKHLNNHPSSIIDSGLYWSKTKRGHQFWRDTHKEWVELVFNKYKL